MLSYRVMLDVPGELSVRRQAATGPPPRDRHAAWQPGPFSCWQQAVFTLAWFRDRPDVARLGRGFGISQATAYRYLAEAISVLAARSPGLARALEAAREQGLAYLILDGKIVAADRCKEKTTSKKGKTIDRWYSGKAHRFGGNIQGLFNPAGTPLWVSPVSPGGVHDLTAAREHAPACAPT